MRWLKTVLVALSLGTVAGCASDQSRVYRFGTRGYENAIKSFAISPERAYQIADDASAYQATIEREPIGATATCYVFDRKHKKISKIGGYFVDGKTGEVTYRPTIE